jgi:hypothetical protein
MLGKPFRRLFLSRVLELHDAGRLRFYGPQTGLCDRAVFQRHLAPVRKKPWVVYAKRPFAGPAALLAYLSRYTHRVAISNRRLLALDERGVTFRYKDYRRDGAERYGTMTLAVDEFIRRFLLHVLPVTEPAEPVESRVWRCARCGRSRVAPRPSRSAVGSCRGARASARR